MHENAFQTSIQSVNPILGGVQSWSFGQNLRDRDIDVPRPRRDRRLKQKVEARLERAEIETRHETLKSHIYKILS